MTRPALAVWLGRMPYGPAWDLQRRVGEAVRRGHLPDTLLLVEHDPVYTIGRAARGSRDNLLWDLPTLQRRGIALYEVDRGGDITYHGPGQLVGYPILDLTRHGRDLHAYLRSLEEGLIRALATWGVTAYRLPPHTGVWVDEPQGPAKIAAIGVKASRWITSHGFALNVAPDLGHFTGIIPCGIRDKGVTSLARLLGAAAPDLVAVRPVVAEALARVWDLAWHWGTPEDLPDGEG
ncbi:Octanoyltransferase [Candidatus Hydrogenisulfobacillus filiaventi]|uniref:Octanoyltransferase n=1 Tax=Candidatus Hydrogenisulfobacillus filiaventi TaxID=2707344 RepID=A0A6F8ZKN0_9FIRM|nr:Octanoyltransferase [Candidatus Hydrogenisulfobacillus filiaventi]